MNRTLFIRLHLTLQACHALVRAAKIKRHRRLASISNTPTSSDQILNDRDITYLITTADTLVRYATFGSGRKCFFRAYILSEVLLQWNMPMTIHIGMRHLGKNSRAQGHCWLTYKDQLFAEAENPFVDYPIDLGANANGLHYWLGHEAR